MGEDDTVRRGIFGGGKGVGNDDTAPRDVFGGGGVGEVFLEA